MAAEAEFGVRPAPCGSLSEEEVVVYAVHKPRNVCSEMRSLGGWRRMLGHVLVDAGLVPYRGHVGRLDAETSGLILVTNYAPAVSALLQSPRPLAKRYELLLAGRKSRADLASLEEPLEFERNGRLYAAGAARLDAHRTLRDAGLASTGFAAIDRVEPAAVLAEEARRMDLLAARRRQRLRDRGLEEAGDDDDWLTVVELTIFQGRHHQIRRLCARAKVELRHLRRLSYGPVELGDLRPGQGRALSSAERSDLFRAAGVGEIGAAAQARRPPRAAPREEGVG